MIELKIITKGKTHKHITIDIVTFNFVPIARKFNGFIHICVMCNVCECVCIILKICKANETDTK